MDLHRRPWSSVSRVGGLSLVIGTLIPGHSTAPAQPPDRAVSHPDDPDPEAIPPLERLVSLNRAPRTRRAALEEICRQAGIALRLDEPAIAAVGLNLDELASVTITGEPLQEALGRLIDWTAHPGAYRELRGGTLVLTTLQATKERTLRHLPEWLRPLYNNGLLATVDDAGDVTAVTSGEVMTDELLAKLKTMPKLHELDVQTTKTLTKRGLAHLVELPSLESLTLYSVNVEGAGLGDEAMEVASRIPTLRSLSVGECGTTDAGVRHLEAMPQLTHLKLDEGRLTDSALASIAKLTRLRHLDLSSYVGTISYGRMRFTPEALRKLAKLKELENLQLAGQAPSAELFLVRFPKLTSLSVGDIDDTSLMRISRYRRLRQLVLLYPDITDGGLKSIATLPDLRHLSLSCTVITDAGMAHLGALPRLEHLELRATKVGDETLRHLAEIRTLTRLDLHGSGLPGAILGQRFTAEGLRQLKRLPRLRTLWLANLRLNGGFGVLKELTQLRDLTLTMTDISEGEVAALEDTLPNTRVNAMTGAGRIRPPKRR